MHWAAANGEVAEVKRFLRANVVVDEPDERNRTPLDWAACRNRPQVIVALVEAGADVNRTDREEGLTPILLASKSISDNAVIALVDVGADVNCQDKNPGWMPLHYAILYGQEVTVEKLINAKGADVDKAANNGTTPLHLAAGLGKTEAITMLVKAGANLHATDDEGNTPLDNARKAEQLDAVQLLEKITS